MKSRLPLPDISQFDAAQRSVYESILSTRGNLDGPFLAWMHSPEFASRAEKVGAFCRYQTGLDLVESELLILCVAQHFHCRGEQQIHEPVAIQAGLPEAVVTALREGKTPQFATPRLTLLHRFAGELTRTNRVSPATYEEAIRTFGERVVVELVGVIGYYTLVAMTLNAFEMEK